MANSSIETLLQVVTPPRANETPPRAGDGGGSFGPALEQALAADKPAAAAAPPGAAPDAAEHLPVGDNSAAVEYDPPHDAEDDNVQAEAADEPVHEAPAEEGVDEDAVEISEAAETVAIAGTQQTAQPEIPVKAPYEAELGLTAGGAEGEATEQGATETADAEQENAADVGPHFQKPAKPLLTAAVEEVKSTSAHSAKDSAERKDSAKKVRTEKHDLKSPASGATPPAAGQPGAEASETPGDEDAKNATTKNPTLDAEAAGEADVPAAPHETRRQSAGSQAATPLAEPAAVAVEALDDAVRDDSRQPADKAGVRPIASDNAAPPIAPATGSRGAASLDRLTAPRAIHPAAPPADGDGGLPVDRARFIGRVEGAMRTAQQRDGRVQVRLSPPELGSLRIEITVQHGVLHAKIEAETPTARNLLLDNLPALRERLAQQDMRVEKFDVDVRRDGGGQTSGNGAQDRQADQPSWRDGDRRDRPTPNREAPTPRVPRVTPAARISDAELDVRI